MTHEAASIPLINAATVNATATVTGEWRPAHNWLASTLYAWHASSAGTGDVTYYVDLYYKGGVNPNNETVAATDYYRVTLGNLAADSTVTLYTPAELGEVFTWIRGVAIGQAANEADTVSYLWIDTY